MDNKTGTRHKTTDIRPQTSETSRQRDSNPLVSIIVPSYNQGAFIKDTLDSILRQDYRPLEALVIDGASTDGTIEILHQYDNEPEITWISESDSGQIEAVNKGFAMARGEICAIQSSDDFYLTGAIQRGVQELLNNPALGLVFGDIITIDANGNELMKSVLKPFSLENILSCQTWIPQPSCFFRLSLAKELGGWRDSVSYAADTDLWMRILLKANAEKIDMFMAKRRMHADQRDLHGDKIIRDFVQMINDWFENFNAPPSMRYAAEAGILLLKNRYSYNDSHADKSNRIEDAKRIFPPLKDALKGPVSTYDLIFEIIKRIKIKFMGIY